MWCHLIRIEFKKAMSLEQMMISKQNKRHSYLFKLEFLSWHSHVRGDMHFKSLDYPHSHVSVMFYTRFLTHGYTKHRCELLWITRSRLIILKCCKLVLRLSRQSSGAKHHSCPEILNCTCIYAISYTIGNVGNRLGCNQENRNPTFSFPNKLNKCFFDESI